MLSMSGCGDKTNINESENKSDLEKYLTAEQLESVSSVKSVSDDASLFEMTYTADYKLNDVLALGSDSFDSYCTNINKLIIPKELNVEKPVAPKKSAGCSAFSVKSSDGAQIMGRNYDWNIGSRTNVVVHTSPKDGYASVGVSDLGFLDTSKIKEDDLKANLLYAPYYTVDGVNEKGFACAVLVLEDYPVSQNNGKTDLMCGAVVRLLLDKASTVDEAIKLFEGYDLHTPIPDCNFHWLVTDKSGDKAVIETVNNKLSVVRADEGKDYLPVTNYYLTKGVDNSELEGFWRYDKIDKALQKNTTPTQEEAMDILESVRYYMNDKDYMDYMKKVEKKDPKNPDDWEWETVWSEVFNVNDGTLSLCYKEKYNKVYQFGIN